MTSSNSYIIASDCHQYPIFNSLSHYSCGPTGVKVSPQLTSDLGVDSTAHTMNREPREHQNSSVSTS